MSEFTLKAEPALGGYRNRFDGVALEEVIDLSIVSIAVPRGGEQVLGAAMNCGFWNIFPEARPNNSVCRRNDTFSWVADRSGFRTASRYADVDVAEIIADHLGETAYFDFAVGQLGRDYAFQGRERLQCWSGSALSTCIQVFSHQAAWPGPSWNISGRSSTARTMKSSCCCRRGRRQGPFCR